LTTTSKPPAPQTQRTLPDTPAALFAAGRAPPAPLDPRTEGTFFSFREEPLARFQALLALAQANIYDATAMSLATVSPEGRPSSRIVLLKAVDEQGFSFFTNLGSRKGREALGRPDVALLFHWGALEVQVRIEGLAGRVPDQEADDYFATRPRGSQLGAWASVQSAPLASRAELEQRLVELTARFDGKPVTRPPGWSGFRVSPLAIEFWRNRESRLHDRELYTRAHKAAPWMHTLLNP
jgi:pyridoxamine 5'-phosphate oxidase